MKSVIRFFAERHKLANIITLMIALLGLGTLATILRDNFPRVDIGILHVTTFYPGASPEDVELNVTNKIEKQLQAVEGLQRITSYSMENLSNISITLDINHADKAEVKNRIREAIANVPDLPTEVDEKPTIEEESTVAIPIIEIGISGDLPYAELRELARQTEKKLLDLDGIASIQKYGYRDREIQVELQPNALEKYQIAASEVADKIRNRNLRATGGSFSSYTSETNIVTLAQFKNIDEVSEVVIKHNDQGAIVRVHDVAKIKDDFARPRVVSHMNGKPAISLLLFKQASADIIRTVDTVKAFVIEHRKQLPANVELEYSADQSRIVKSRLTVMLSNGFGGLLLVLIVLSLSLEKRIAFWVAMSIPITLLGCIFLLPLFDAYLDSIVLAAMILVLGIIVDDSIVVAENIWSYRERGYAPIDAAVEGTANLLKPVSATILTTILAFSPLFFVSGVMGDFIFVIPLVVVLALVISWVDVTLIMPAHFIANTSNQVMPIKDKTQSKYIKQYSQKILNKLLGLRYFIVSGFLLLLLTAFWYAGRYMDFVLFPAKTADVFYLSIEMPDNSSSQRTMAKVKEIEAIINQLPSNELDSYVSRIGLHYNYPGENTQWALFEVYLSAYAERERNAEEIVDALRPQLAALKTLKQFSFAVEGGGAPVGEPINLRIIGSNDQLRKDLANTLQQRLQQITGVKDIQRNDQTGKQQIKIAIDYLRLASYQLEVKDIVQAVQLAYDGDIVTAVRYGHEDVKFRVLLDASARSSAQSLGELLIRNPQGRFIQLREVAVLEMEAGTSSIYHYDNERAILMTANVDNDTITAVDATEQVLANLDINQHWPGMKVLSSGEAEETDASMTSLLIAFISAIICIYFVLLLLFDSLTQPFVVMLVIPFGVLGVIIAFALHHEPFSFLAMLGVIGLTGILVNDSLILVNRFNQLCDSYLDKPVREIVVMAATQRFRAITLTSITTVAGLLPMAYGIGGSDPFSAPMALAMGYGILFATLLTLLLLPCLLMIQYDVSVLFNKDSHA